ncbi:MAG: glycosyltransferase [Clostridium sp.]|nr:glycosyltransferase [Clostridium sp.]
MYRNRRKDLVSIVVSNYNNEKYIVECLDSVINQTYKSIEIIIVDDCSTDKSVQLIESWISRRSEEEKRNIVFLCLPRNTGFSGAVTAGLYLARGEYIAMQDGDDVSHLNRIETELNYLKNREDINMVGTNYAVFENYVGQAKVLPNFVVYGKSNIEDVFHNGGSPVCYGTILFRGKVFDDIGGLTRRIMGAEDYEFIARALVHGIENINEVLYFVRAHPEQRSRIYYGNGDKTISEEERHEQDRRKTQINKEKENRENELSVLLVLDKFNIGGTETHVLSIAGQLISKGIKVTVIGAHGPLEYEFTKLKCKIYNVDFPASIEKCEMKRESYLNKINEIIKTEGINVIHAHQSSSGSLCVEEGKRLNIPCIFTLHGKYYFDILDNTLKDVDKVISVSIPVQKWLKERKIESEIVPNGVDFSKKINESNYVREKYNIPYDSLVIAYCSRMAWGKTKVCKNLIRCIASLRKNENIKYHGIIIGDGQGYHELNIMTSYVNKKFGEQVIHLEGPQTEVYKYYVSSDCILGTGRVAIEAISCFKNVIAAGNCGYHGIVTSDNFDEAWKVYFGDHDSKRTNNPVYLYKDMRDYYLHKDYYNKEVNDIYDKSKLLFDSDIVTSRLIGIYGELVN